MNTSEHHLLALISAPQCLRGFNQIYLQLRTAVNTAFKIEYLKGERDNALYWKKQGDVLAKMKLKADKALQFAPEASARFDTSTHSFAHLAHPSVFRVAFLGAEGALIDLVTHYDDFVKALQMEQTFFMDPVVGEALVHERPTSEAVLHALEDLRNLASAVLRQVSTEGAKALTVV